MESDDPQRPLRGAVIGTGYFSDFHLDAWRRIGAREIVACCDLDRAKAEASASRYGIPRCFDDVETMLERCQLDFVDVITRPDTHVDLCVAIAERGIDLICQKPLAPDFEQAKDLVRRVAATGVRMMVHENFRFQPWYREAKRVFEAGQLGSQLHTITFRNRAGDGWGEDAYLGRQPYFRDMPRLLIFEAGIHTIDTFRFLAGEVRRVWCLTRKLNPVIAGEDTALAVFEFESGGVGLYDANRYNESTAENPRYTFGELLFETDAGSLRLYADGRLTTQALGQAETDHEYQHSELGFAGDCVHATQRHFIDCLRSGQPFETDGASYLRSLAVQEALYRSAQSGGWERPDFEASEVDHADH